MFLIKDFYSFSSLCYANWKSVFFHGNSYLAKTVLHDNHAASQSKLSLKNGVKQIKTTQKSCRKRVSPTLLLNIETLTSTMKSKYSKNFLFGFLLPFAINLSEFDLFNMSDFYNSAWISLKELCYKHNLIFIKLRAIFKKSLSVAFFITQYFYDQGYYRAHLKGFIRT